MKQRIRPLLLLKKQLGSFQRVRSNTYAIGNRLMNDVLFGAPRPLRGWSDGKDCAGGDAVVLDFTKEVYYTNGATGITITATGGKTLNTIVAIASGEKTQQYTGTWSAALEVGDVVTITYDADTGDYNDGDPTDPEYTKGFTFKVANCLDIPATNLAAVSAGQTAVNLTWTDPVVTTGYENYILKRNGVQIATPAIGVQAYADSGLTANTTYSYTLQTRANGADIGSALSASAKTDPASAVDGWATETGGDWQTESGDRWILE